MSIALYTVTVRPSPSFNSWSRLRRQLLQADNYNNFVRIAGVKDFKLVSCRCVCDQLRLGLSVTRQDEYITLGGDGGKCPNVNRGNEL